MSEPTSIRNPSFSGGVQTVWDSTSIKLFQECPRKYFLKMVWGFDSPLKSVHLRFGGLYASALEHYYKLRALGSSDDEATVAVVKEALCATWDSEKGQPEVFSHNAKNRTGLIRTIVWYLAEFGEESPDTALQTIFTEDGRPCVELSFRFNVAEGIDLAGHLDRVVSYVDQLYVLDNKTTGATLGQYYFHQYSPDTQMSLYTFGGQVVLKKPVRGVVIDAAQILVNSSTFARGFTYRTPEQLNEWWAGTEHYIRLAQHFADGPVEEQRWPMNPTACGNYGGCEFREVCSASARVRERILRDQFNQRVWNPAEAR